MVFSTQKTGQPTEEAFQPAQVEVSSVAGNSSHFNLQRLQPRHTVMLNLSNLLAAGTNLPDTLLDSLQMLAQFIGVEIAQLFRYEPRQSALVGLQPFYSLRPLPPETEEYLNNLLMRLDEPGSAVYAFNTGKAFFLNHPSNATHINHERVKRLGIRNVLVVPIMVEKQVQGVCCLLNKIEDEFNERDLADLEDLGGLLGMLLKSLNTAKHLNIQQRRHAAVLDAAVDGFLEVGRDFRIISFSKGAENLTGWTSDEALGHTCSEVLMPHSPDNQPLCQRCPLKRAFESNAPISNVETLIRSREGEDSWVSCSYSAVTDESGEIHSGVITVKDIYRLKALSDELMQQAQQQESLLGVNNAINRLSNIEEIYKVSLDQIANAISFDVGIIHSIEPDTGELTLMSFLDNLALPQNSSMRPQTLNVRQYRRQQLRNGANQPEIFTPHAIPIPLNIPFVQQHHVHDCQALVQKEPYMAVNMPGREVCPVVHEFGNLQSHLCVPITTQDRTYGVLHLASRKAYAFWGSDFVLALNICKQIGVAAERARLFEEVDRLARTDALTGLYNKREFWERIEREIRRAGRRHVPLSLMIIDLDRLKWINDCFGHNHGDTILAQLGEMVRIESRASDIAFRYGGDELCILLPDTMREEAKIAAERLRSAARGIQIGQDSGQILIGNDTGLTMSIGIASFPSDATDAVQLFERADAAMYRAKETGKDRAVLFDMSVDNHRLNYRRRAIENDLQDDRLPRRRTGPLPPNER